MWRQSDNNCNIHYFTLERNRKIHFLHCKEVKPGKMSIEKFDYRINRKTSNSIEQSMLDCRTQSNKRNMVNFD